MPTPNPIASGPAFCATPTTSARLLTAAFAHDAQLTALASGRVGPLAQAAIRTVQLSLYSLGMLPQLPGIDGHAGPVTAAALTAFQTQAHLPMTGAIDQATIMALDQAMQSQICALRASTVPQGSKHSQFHIVADVVDATNTRLFVLDTNDRPVASYLTSPGTARYPTLGSHFTIQQVLPRRAWTPPSSAWAASSQVSPPGISNPMGILKLSLGAYAEYIHGVPPGELPELGRAASHGCLRLSGANILDLSEHYAEAGTSVTINRDAAVSTRLRAAWRETGRSERPINTGREYLFGYVSGELGTTQTLSGT